MSVLSFLSGCSTYWAWHSSYCLICFSLLEATRFVLQADGNCMYRAIAHQCQVHCHISMLGHCDPTALHLALRQKAAQHIVVNAATFLPFIIDGDSSRSADEQLADFCTGVEGHEWGSHVELHALSETLCVGIQVCFLDTSAEATLDMQRNINVENVGFLALFAH